ncbi:hypothetical protein [Rubrivivax gelatinosus]|uniref:Uncharacterized protein n=1 Tax=Rubrivivax gelatinosus TaxID=28068 RepID=A0A4R2M5J9_RUBGE|nr:hypothetical protein [Rubrivivax gelatinosus]MBK1688146.1 hypothetical protein [Rubrivivax gelatinosus]TCP02509.1 hypothetical protein EV684_10671 [Rubrivivax gelatinosus]
MNAADPSGLARLRFLGETVAAEAAHLASTDGRLFATPFAETRARSLAAALEAGHAFVPLLLQTAAALGAELKRRFSGA